MLRILLILSFHVKEVITLNLKDAGRYNQLIRDSKLADGINDIYIQY